MEQVKNIKNDIRPVVLTVMSKMTERIHEEGIAADGSQIGTYSSNYLKLRQKKYQRTSDKKVIVSLTRQTENSWAMTPTERGWGIGFLNKDSAQKMQWVEEQKGKKIAQLTTEEKDYAIKEITKIVDEILK